MVLPLVFSYSVTILRKEASSSGTKPWSQYTVAVFPAALAMNGRPSVPAAASPADPRRTERLLSSLMPVLFDFWPMKSFRPTTGDFSHLVSAPVPRGRPAMDGAESALSRHDTGAANVSGL